MPWKDTLICDTFQHAFLATKQLTCKNCELRKRRKTSGCADKENDGGETVNYK